MSRRRRGVGGKTAAHVAGALAAQGAAQWAQQQQDAQPTQGEQQQAAANPYDFSADPILQRVQALGERRVAEAEATALAARRQLAIDSGDESLAPDEQTREQARNNPFSVAALWRKKSHDAPQALDADLSRGSLGYSSAGATQQSNLATSLLAEQQSNQADTRSRMSAIEAALSGARQQSEDDYTNAQGEAAQRLQDRLGDLPVGQQGGGGGGSGGQGLGHSGGGGGVAAALAHQGRRRGGGRARAQGAARRAATRHQGLRP